MPVDLRPSESYLHGLQILPAPDPSLRLKNGSAQDDAMKKMHRAKRCKR
jgi:hypothetical protein